MDLWIFILSVGYNLILWLFVFMLKSSLTWPVEVLSNWLFSFSDIFE